MYTKAQMKLLDSPLAEVHCPIATLGHPVFVDVEHCFQILSSLGVNLKPHYWVSDDWFTPDGVAGFAVPFYLLDEELSKLYKKCVGEIEGESQARRLKVIMHELGHVVDNSFKLRQCAVRREVFGSSRKTYPKSYTPDYSCREGFDFLGDRYYQAHSDEDFAESFASWAVGTPEYMSHSLSSSQYHRKSALEFLLQSRVLGKPQVLNNRTTPDLVLDQYQTFRYFLLAKKREIKIAVRSRLNKYFTQQIDASRFGRDDISGFLISHRNRYSKILYEAHGVRIPISSALVLRLAESAKSHRLRVSYSESTLDKKIVDFLMNDSLTYIKQGYHRIVL